MKYIKKYEEIETEDDYQVGDWVILNLSNSDGYELIDAFGDDYKSSEIIAYISELEYSNEKFPYVVAFEPNSSQVTSVSKDEIVRKLTPDEIEIRKNVKKYNL